MFGARELKRTIKVHVETPLTDLMLEGTVKEGMLVNATAGNEEIVFEPVSLEAASPAGV